MSQRSDPSRQPRTATSMAELPSLPYLSLSASSVVKLGCFNNAMQCSINGGHVYDAISSIAPTVAISTALGFAAIRTLCRYILYTTEPVFGVLNELNG